MTKLEILFRGLVFLLTLVIANEHLKFQRVDESDFSLAIDQNDQTIKKRLDFEDQEQYVQVVKQSSCENITKAELLTIFSKYPYVRVRCEAEQTILSPIELSNYGRDPLLDLEYGAPMKKGTYRLIESGARLEIDKVFLRFPISPCVRPSNPGTGLIEVFITLNTLVMRMKEVSGNIPIIDMQAGRAQSNTKGKEYIYSTTCMYRDLAVRPAVEVAALVTKFLTREWTVRPDEQNFISKSEWRNSTVAELADSTLMIACLSERYVPDVCTWTESHSMATLSKYFST